MQFRKFVWAVALILLATGLTACNIGKAPEPTQDVNAIYTSAAGTMIAQLNDQQTQTAQAIPPTPLSSPTALPSITSAPTFPVSGGTPFTFNTPGAFTPIASPFATLVPGGSGSTARGCNDAAFMSETIPDKTEMKPEQAFKKSWQFMNSGTCTWDEGYVFAFVSGDQMDGKDILIDEKEEFTAPQSSQTFIVPMIAPKAEGEYQGYWQMKNDAGEFFGSRVWVLIIVKK